MVAEVMSTSTSRRRHGGEAKAEKVMFREEPSGDAQIGRRSRQQAAYRREVESERSSLSVGPRGQAARSSRSSLPAVRRSATCAKAARLVAFPMVAPAARPVSPARAQAMSLCFPEKHG